MYLVCRITRNAISGGALIRFCEFATLMAQALLKPPDWLVYNALHAFGIVILGRSRIYNLNGA